MKKLTVEQAIVITGFTGIMAVESFGTFHEDAEKRLGRPVFTHEFGTEKMKQALQEAYREDFLAMVPERNTEGV